jgi:hypothetical protein
MEILKRSVAGAGHALVHPVDGGGHGHVAVGDLADLAGVRPQAAPRRGRSVVAAGPESGTGVPDYIRGACGMKVLPAQALAGVRRHWTLGKALRH